MAALLLLLTLTLRASMAALLLLLLPRFPQAEKRTKGAFPQMLRPA